MSLTRLTRCALSRNGVSQHPKMAIMRTSDNHFGKVLDWENDWEPFFNIVRLIGWLTTWVCLKIGYIPNYSHFIGIMISKTIGFRGFPYIFRHTHFRFGKYLPNRWGVPVIPDDPPWPAPWPPPGGWRLSIGPPACRPRRSLPPPSRLYRIYWIHQLYYLLPILHIIYIYI